MMAALWQDVLDDIEAACVHYGEAIALFEEPGFAPAGTPNYRDRMAFLHAMQSGYTSFEAGLRRILAVLDEPMPVGPEWHTALVRRVARPLASSRPAIIGPELENAVLELMRFAMWRCRATTGSATRRLVWRSVRRRCFFGQSIPTSPASAP